MTGGDDLGERQHAPSVAARTVGCELVLVLVQAGQGAEVDHLVAVAQAGSDGEPVAHIVSFPAAAADGSLRTNHSYNTTGPLLR